MTPVFRPLLALGTCLTLSAGSTAYAAPAPPTAPSPVRSADVSTPRWRTPSYRGLLKDYRLVGFCGYPGIPGQGRLGIGRLDDRAKEIVAYATSYARVGKKATIPTMELIAATVQGSPGRDRKWRTRTSDAIIARHLKAARKVNAMLLLNVQPGQSSFLTEAKALEKWLKHKDVGLALDPEWRMHPGQVPMRQFGWVSSTEVNQVTAYVAGLVKTYRLPEKVVLVHQLNTSVLRDQKALRPAAGIAMIRGVDGIGSRGAKTATYTRLTAGSPAFFRPGFKLFFVEDRWHGRLMSVAQVMALTPRPDYVMYE